MVPNFRRHDGAKEEIMKKLRTAVVATVAAVMATLVVLVGVALGATVTPLTAQGIVPPKKAEKAPSRATPKVAAPVVTPTVIGDYQLSGLPEVSTSGDFIQLEVVCSFAEATRLGFNPQGDGPYEVEVVVPAAAAPGGRFFLNRPHEMGHVWEWRGELIDLLHEVDGHISRRRAGGAPNLGVSLRWWEVVSPAP